MFPDFMVNITLCVEPQQQDGTCTPSSSTPTASAPSGNGIFATPRVSRAPAQVLNTRENLNATLPSGNHIAVVDRRCELAVALGLNIRL